MYALIVESPAKCKTISKYLGKDYKILSSFGHIRALPTKKGSVDTEKNFKMVYDLTEQGRKVIPDIVKQIKGVKALYLATDPDREGEAISWHLLEVLKKKRALPAKVHRVVFNQITQSAIQEAIKKPRDIDINLVNAQRLRQALDYLVGFSISPILWKKLPGSRSAGRVQSVALRILCQRENEIDKFIPEEYWNIYADILSNCGKKVKAELVHADGNKLEKTDIKSQSQAEKIVESISDQKFLIQKINKKDIKKSRHCLLSHQHCSKLHLLTLGLAQKKLCPLLKNFTKV
jgi:DNA topoisomerase-1